MDMEKVIKGFECCHVMVHDLGPDKTSCGICPYKNVQTEEQIDLGGIECIAVLHDDALALLKEQPEIVRCKDCKHRPKEPNLKTYESGFDIEFPEGSKCPCQCSGDEYYSWYPEDDWFCADGERKDS